MLHQNDIVRSESGNLYIVTHIKLGRTERVVYLAAQARADNKPLDIEDMVVTGHEESEIEDEFEVIVSQVKDSRKPVYLNYHI